MRNITILLLCFVTSTLWAQPLSLEQCYQMARANYPLVQRAGLIDQSRDFNLRNARSASYPQFSLSGKATYQTEVPSLPMMPNSIPKDQYNVMAEITQSIWDGGATRSQKMGVRATAEVESRLLEVDLYALNERVDNLFFGILMLDEQLSINKLLDAELVRSFQKVESYIAAGVANGADLDAVSVEILSNNQRRAQIAATRKAYVLMLSAMVGSEVEGLVRPAMPTVSREIRSVELSLFDAQIAKAEVQKKSINARYMPKIGAFVQGAYGQPGLNFLNGGFSPYAMGGLRLSWNFGGLYTRKSDMAIIDIQKKSIDVQRNTFLFNTDLSVTQTNAQVERLTQQMRDDEQIITLRGNIKRSSEARVAGGTMSVTDMLGDVTKENTAILERQLHGVELLKTLYEIKTKTNN